MPSELWQRIRAARKHSELTQDQVADHFNISKAAVAQWESANAKNRTRPDINKLQELAKITGAPLSWLMDDSADCEEKFWLEAAPDPSNDPPLARGLARTSEPPAAYGMEPILAWEHPDDLPEGEFIMIPRLDVHLSAGNGHEQVEIGLVKENPQAFRTEWIRQQRLKPAKLAAMRAAGESMEPTIHDGDSLLVDTSQTTVSDGKVYALWYDGGERVKRLFRLPGGGLRIVSDNPRYPTVEVATGELEHVRVIGRVVHRSGVGGL